MSRDNLRARMVQLLERAVARLEAAHEDRAAAAAAGQVADLAAALAAIEQLDERALISSPAPEPEVEVTRVPIEVRDAWAEGTLDAPDLCVHGFYHGFNCQTCVANAADAPYAGVRA